MTRPNSGGRAARRAVALCRIVSILALGAIAVVLLQGGGRWRLLGHTIRLDKPTNPILILAACEAIRAWLLAAGEAIGARLGRAARAAGWTCLAVLIVTMCIDRSAARRSSTPWRRDTLGVGAAAFVAAIALERRRKRTLSRREASVGERGTPRSPDVKPAGAGGSASPIRDEGVVHPVDKPTPQTGCSWPFPAFHLDAATLLFVGCCVWALTSALASPFRPETVHAWTGNWLLALGMFWVVRLARTGETSARALAVLLVLALALAIGVGALQFVVGHSRFDLLVGRPESALDRFRTARAAGLSLSPNFLGLLLAGLILFVLALAARADTRTRAAGFYLLVALGMGVLVMTRSRGALIAAVCGAVFLAILLRRRMGLSLLLVAGIGLLSLVGTHSERFLGLVRVVTRGEASPELVGWRPILWKSAVTLSAERPILGWGTGQEVFETAFHRMHPEAAGKIEAFHAHNLYLETAFETGFTGLGLFGILVVGIAARAWRIRGRRSPSDRTLALGAAAALFAILLHGLVDYPLNRGTWLLLGVTLAVLAGGDHTSLEGTGFGPAPSGASDPKSSGGKAIHGED